MELEFMDNQEKYNSIIETIIKEASWIKNKMVGVSLEEFKDDEELSSAIAFKLIQICEYGKKLPDHFKKKHSEIPWKDITNMRNIIVHDYGHAEIEIIYETASNDMYEMIDSLSKIEKESEME